MDHQPSTKKLQYLKVIKEWIFPQELICQIRNKFFFTATRNTFLLFCFSYRIKHIDGSGKLLGSIDYNNKALDLEMLNDRLLLLVTDFSSQKIKVIIILWQLENHEVNQCQHFLQRAYHSTVLFPQSQLICVIENQKGVDDTVYILTYYRIQGDRKMQKVKAQAIQVKEQSRSIKIMKLNNSSMIGFFQNLTANLVMFKTFSLDLNQQVSANYYTFNYKYNPNIYSSINSVVTDAWEVNQGKFYIQIENSQKNKRQRMNKMEYGLIKKSTQEGFQRWYNILWDSNSNSFQDFPFETKQAHRVQFVGHLRNFIQTSTMYQVFKSVGFYKNEEQNIKFYYICPQSLEVVGLVDKLGYKSWSRNEPTMMILTKVKQILHQNGRKMNYKLQLVETPPPYQIKILSVFFLINFYEQWDQDLLYWVAELASD